MRSGGACVRAGAIERSKRVNVRNRGEGRQVWVSLGVRNHGAMQGSGEERYCVGSGGHRTLLSSCPGLRERVSRHPCSASDQPVPGEWILGRILLQHLIGKVCVFTNVEKNQLGKQ